MWRASSDNKVELRRRRDAGVALIEAAFVLPILLVLAMGMLDFGRAFHAKHLLDEAAREGCRVAVVTAPDPDIVTARVGSVLSAGGLTATSVAVDGPNAARMVTVTVQATFTFVTPGVFSLFNKSFGNTLAMTGQSTMRFESP
jgi:Flp pilus assembly protein TadG